MKCDKLTGNEIPIKEYSKMYHSKNEVQDAEYSVMIRITEACNFNCDMCKWNKGKHFNLNDIYNSIDNLLKFCKSQNFNKIHFYFMGGEPCVHPDFGKILKYLKKQEFEITIEVQTNLTLNNYSDYYEFIDQFAITFHYEELINNKKYDTFMKNIYSIPSEKLLTLDISLELMDESNKLDFYKDIEKLILLDFENLEYIYNFYLYDKNQECFDQHYDFYKEKVQYKEQQSYIIDGIVRTPNELFNRGLTCEGIKCDAGKSGITMNGNGEIFRCDTLASNNTIYNQECYLNILTDKHYMLKLKLLYKFGTICPINKCTSAFYNEKRR